MWRCEIADGVARDTALPLARIGVQMIDTSTTLVVILDIVAFAVFGFGLALLRLGFTQRQDEDVDGKSLRRFRSFRFYVSYKSAGGPNYGIGLLGSILSLIAALYLWLRYH